MGRYKVYKNMIDFEIVESISKRHIQDKINFIPVAVIAIDEKNRIKPQPGFYYPGEEPSGGGWQ